MRNTGGVSRQQTDEQTDRQTDGRKTSAIVDGGIKRRISELTYRRQSDQSEITSSANRQ